MTIKYHAIKECVELGVPNYVIGFSYLVDAIAMAYKDESKLLSVTKALYPEIAKKHNTTRQAVEIGIRRAIAASSYHVSNRKFIINVIFTLRYKHL